LKLYVSSIHYFKYLCFTILFLNIYIFGFLTEVHLIVLLVSRPEANSLRTDLTNEDVKLQQIVQLAFSFKSFGLGLQNMMELFRENETDDY